MLNSKPLVLTVAAAAGAFFVYTTGLAVVFVWRSVADRQPRAAVVAQANEEVQPQSVGDDVEPPSNNSNGAEASAESANRVEPKSTGEKQTVASDGVQPRPAEESPRLATPIGTPDKMHPAAMQSIKAATVLVKSQTKAFGAKSASGFLARLGAKENRGLIVTTFEVLQPVRRIGYAGASYQCVFHSGTPEEATVDAALKIADPKSNIGVLEVEYDKLPVPIELATKVEIVETTPLFRFGYPFGESLSSGSKNPAVTVSRANVSSLRRNIAGGIAAYQLDSANHPGVVGGPVVTGNGRLVAIALPRVPGERVQIVNAEVGFAIPAAPIHKRIFAKEPLARAKPKTPTTSPQANITKPKPPRPNAHKLPAAYTQVVRAGDKYLIFNLGDYSPHFALVGVRPRGLRNYLDVDGSGLCAANGEKAFYYSFKKKTLERWDLKSLRREANVRLRLPFEPTLFAMGSHSQGPLIIGGGEKSSAARFFDINTLKPLTLAYDSNDRFQLNDRSQLRVSADGRVFCTWSRDNKDENYVLVVEGRNARLRKVPFVGYLTPNSDGSRIYTSRGVFSTKFERMSEEREFVHEFAVPSVTGEFYLQLERTDADKLKARHRNPLAWVYSETKLDPVATLQDINVRGGTKDDLSAQQEIPIDQALHLYPTLGTLITLDKKDRKGIVYYSVNPGAALRIQEKEGALAFRSQPDSNRISLGETFTYQLEAESEEGGVRYFLHSAPPGLEIDSEGKISWLPVPAHVGEQTVVVSAVDVSGAAVFQTFKIRVLGKMAR